jgi:uncharacterized membrane protein
MSKVEDFLSKQEEQEVVEAIRIAERNTSGEIRVHLEEQSSTDAYTRAVEVFHLLKMDTTQDRNAVLFYIAVKDKNFVIYGDININKTVPNNFWDTTKNTMRHHFKHHNFKQGLIEGILSAGKQLQTHFPYQKNDIDELSNEISKS